MKNYILKIEKERMDQTLKIWNPLLKNFLSVKQNIQVIAIRPFVSLRSIEMNIGDIMEGPTSYPYKAVKHQIISTAIFRGSLLSVSFNLQFIPFSSYKHLETAILRKIIKGIYFYVPFMN